MRRMTWSDPAESLAEVRARHQEGKAQKFVFFWGHQDEPDGRVGKGCFSQWYPSPFTVDGVGYATAEHYMMAAKARLFGDDVTLRRVLAAGTPGEAKKLGRQVRGFDEEVWVANRFALVAEGSLAKFGQLPELGEVLRTTGSRVLVEASPRDRIWGIGLASSDPAVEDPTRWRGLNLLGFALMAARERL